jgi:hypothetical protein
MFFSHFLPLVLIEIFEFFPKNMGMIIAHPIFSQIYQSIKSFQKIQQFPKIQAYHEIDFDIQNIIILSEIVDCALNNEYKLKLTHFHSFNLLC